MGVTFSVEQDILNTMLEKKNISKYKKKEVTNELENVPDDLENPDMNNLSDSSSVTDVDILTKKSPNKDDQDEENERTDGSLRK